MKKEAEVFLWRSSWNTDVPLYVIFRAFSCISSFDLWGIFLQTYLHSYKNKGLKQRHCIVTTIQSNGHYTFSLVKINHCTWHYLLSIIMVSLKLLETKKRFLPVFLFMWLSWSHIKIIDNHCSKSLTINIVFLSSLYQ